MNILAKLRNTSQKRVFVLSLDGVPFTFLQQQIARGNMPHFASLLPQGSLTRIRSSIPPISAVAWASYMTGKNPGKHNIFGFIDRKPGTYDTYIPTARVLAGETLWGLLSRAGKRVIVMNVPVTYPPRPVNGLLIGGFLSPKLENATYPPELAARLAQWGYVIDADPWQLRQAKSTALQLIRDALRARARALFQLLDTESWDFFHCHIMETDRINHFIWEEWETGVVPYAAEFEDFYREIDDLVGQVAARVADASLIILSDHGFCTLRHTVDINYWLQTNGWLRFTKNRAAKLADIHPSSQAYSLDPGRVFINLRGREPQGSVAAGWEYENLRNQIADAARRIVDPQTGTPVVQCVLRREEAYTGQYASNAADLLLMPHDGYDLKGKFGKDKLTDKDPAVVGTHTYDDAFAYVRGVRFAEGDWWIADLFPTITRIMGITAPRNVDGRAMGIRDN